MSALYVWYIFGQYFENCFLSKLTLGRHNFQNIRHYDLLVALKILTTYHRLVQHLDLSMTNEALQGGSPATVSLQDLALCSPLPKYSLSPSPN